MTIAIGADHRGLEAARKIAEHIRAGGREVRMMGPCDESPCDYPERAAEVARAVASGEAELGILLCGTGIGMSIAANKVRGVRAAVVHDELTAELSRSHNDANVLCLSADLMGEQALRQIVDRWLATGFEGGRHARRVRKIAAIEQGEDPATVPD